MTNSTPVSRRNLLKLTGAISAGAAFTATLSACGNQTPAATGSPTASDSPSATGSASPTGGINENGTIAAAISYELGTNGYDPMTTTAALTTAVNWHTLEGLTELDPATREVYNALAASDPVKVDDTHYEVTLRTGALFHDGTPVTTEDVAYSFERVLNPDNKSLYVTFLPFLDSVSKKDDTTVTVNLKYAFSLVAERLSVVKIVPKAAVLADAKAFDMNPIGSGPYKMTDNGASSQTVGFERFADYNGPRPALAANMTWQIIPDDSTRTNALSSDTVQAIDSVPAANLTTLASTKSVAAEQGFGLLFAMFNCSTDSPMNDVRNRQAVMYALDYPKICDTGMSGLATPATSFVQKEHPSYKEAKVQYAGNQAKAKELLAATGLTAVRVLASDHGWFAAVRPMIKESLEAAGLTVTYEEKKSADVYGTIDGDPKSFDIVIAPGDPSVFGDDADLLLRWWYDAEVWIDSRMHWKGQDSQIKVAGLLKQGVQETGDAQVALWHEVFDTVSEAVPLYPIFHRKSPSAYDSETLVDFKPIRLTGLSFVGVGSTK